MARPERNSVDYFPFLCEEGNKMFYLEETYGNDGFATFVKLLRELAKTDYHYLNLTKPSTLMYLSAKCKVSKEVLEAIINDLVDLGKFDDILWKENRIIWCQDFIESIQDAYKKRNNKCITYEGLLTLLSSLGIRKQNKLPSIDADNPQSKVKESKVKEIKEEESKEKEGESPDLLNPPPPQIDFKKFVDFFNSNRGNMPEIKIISKSRKQRISTLIKNHSKEKLIEAILICKDSNFIQGANDRDWIADFDWITQPKNFIKILEGNYKNKTNGPSTTPRATFAKNR